MRLSVPKESRSRSSRPSGARLCQPQQSWQPPDPD